MNIITTCKLRKPSMANCPAYVPVIVLLCPAANTPMAQTYLNWFMLDRQNNSENFTYIARAP